MVIVKVIGGLGNQLFQYSAGRVFALKLNTSLKLDLTFYEDPKYSSTYRLHNFNLPYTVANKNEYVSLLNTKTNSIVRKVFKHLGLKIYPYLKNSHIIEDDLLKYIKSEKNYQTDFYLDGWFASEEFFKENRTLLLEEFNADRLLNESNKILKEKIQQCNSIAVHIRRGDYLSNNYFKYLPKKYYENAIHSISKKVEDPIFYFFSDDITWVKVEFSNLKNAIFVSSNNFNKIESTEKNDIEDLMLMRCCKHQIIANSTFSWWGAWLNQNPDKQVYFPAYWFENKKAQINFEKNNFIPKSWLKVKF